MTDINTNLIEQDVEKFFNSYSKTFSSIYSEDDKPRSLFDKIVDKVFRWPVKKRFELTLKYTSNPDIKSVLDIGCGPGHYVVAFLNQGKQVTALDIADEMLDLTRDKVKRLKKEDSVKFIHQSYTDFIPSETYDAACVMGFFDYVPEPVSVLKKLLNDINKEIYISLPNDKGILAWQRKIRYRNNECPLFLYSKESITNYLKEAGCYDKTEIIEDSRGFFLRIVK
jgi:SAM-dependent methyltransferase